MWEFFKGWRRKVGGVTLLLTLMTAGAWCRSQYQVDIVTMECGSSRQMVASTEGRLVWDQSQIQMLGRRDTARFSLTLRIDVSEKVDKSRFRYLNDRSIKWRRRGWGFDFGEARQLSGAHVIFRAIPYWSIVLTFSGSREKARWLRPTSGSPQGRADMTISPFRRRGSISTPRNKVVDRLTMRNAAMAWLEVFKGRGNDLLP